LAYVFTGKKGVLIMQTEIDKSHGSPWDRGRADSYYHRSRDPHCYPLGTYNGDRVTELTDAQVKEYLAGYEWNEKFGDKKSWE
jgi:hypothetical protein